MNSLSFVQLVTRAQAIGLGWFVAIAIILVVVACWCSIKKLTHKDTDQPKDGVDPPLSN